MYEIFSLAVEFRILFIFNKPTCICEKTVSFLNNIILSSFEHLFSVFQKKLQHELFFVLIFWHFYRSVFSLGVLVFYLYELPVWLLFDNQLFIITVLNFFPIVLVLLLIYHFPSLRTCNTLLLLSPAYLDIPACYFFLRDGQTALCQQCNQLAHMIDRPPARPSTQRADMLMLTKACTRHMIRRSAMYV